MINNINPEFTPTGQEMRNISYDAPSYTLAFIAVQWNGSDFSFVNALHNRFEFFPSRWGKWKEMLQPFSVHCFLIAGYNTKTSASGQGFNPVEHIMRFAGIEEARAFNELYRRQYEQWNEFADAELAKAETLKFVEQMRSYCLKRAELLSDVLEQAEEYLVDEQFIADLEFALIAADVPFELCKVERDEDDLLFGALDAIQECIANPEVTYQDGRVIRM
jgi:hypothetical protein